MAGEHLSHDGRQTRPNAIDVDEYERRRHTVGIAHAFLYIVEHLSNCRRLRSVVPGMTQVPGMTATDFTKTSNEAWIIGGALIDLLPEEWNVDKEALEQVAAYRPGELPKDQQQESAQVYTALTIASEYLQTASPEFESITQAALGTTRVGSTQREPDYAFIQSATPALRDAVMRQYALSEDDVALGRRMLEAEVISTVPFGDEQANQ